MTDDETETVSRYQLPITEVLDFAVGVFKDKESSDTEALMAAQVIGSFLVATEISTLAKAIAMSQGSQ